MENEMMYSYQQMTRKYVFEMKTNSRLEVNKFDHDKNFKHEF